MKLKKIIFSFVLFLIAISTIAQNTAHFADSIRKVYGIPEISYAIIDKKTTFEIAATGKHSINLPDTANLNDRFHLGSNTKAMTAFIVAKYVENGKLKWADKFFDLFPEWLAKSKPEYSTITLQDLLSHRAGIQPFQGIGDEDPIIPEFNGTKQENREQFGKFVLSLDPIKPDSARPFVYSNAGYTLATLMLEKVSGKSWEQLVDDVFNTDLGLNVQLSWPENQKRKDTWGHLLENDKLAPVASTTSYHLDYMEPSSDLNITLPDYIKFIQLNLRGLNGEDNYLKSSTYWFIHNGIENYSLGWFNIHEGENAFSTHVGTAGSYYTMAQIDRIKNKAYIIFTNSFSPSTQEGVRLLMRKLKEVHIEP